MTEQDAAADEPASEASTGDQSDGRTPVDGSSRDGTAAARADGQADEDDGRSTDGAKDSPEEDGSQASTESGDGEDDSRSLEQRVAEADPSELAEEIASLRSRVETLETTVEERETTIEDLEDRLRRKQAEFQNYKKRQKERLEDEKQRATEDLVTRLLDVRDNLERALDQDDDADIRDGVESTLRQFDDQLERENVAIIEPASGDAVDPQRHEVLMRVDSSAPEDTVADVHRPGYEMAGKVLRPAQVTVSSGEESAETDGADE